MISGFLTECRRDSARAQTQQHGSPVAQRPCEWDVSFSFCAPMAHSQD
ncbi:MAG: hypothetical protein KME26_30635 [Oscillatoria princeps RMCB-10]|nr:hypothetical protein [Oscillatoria princeps RMCB-10]